MIVIVLKIRSVKALMAERGIQTQKDLAERMAVPPPQVSRLLSTNTPQGMTIRTLDKLCSALHCGPGDVLEWRPDGSSGTAA